MAESVTGSLESVEGILQVGLIAAGIFIAYRVIQMLPGVIDDIPGAGDIPDIGDIQPSDNNIEAVVGSVGVPEESTDPITDPLASPGVDTGFAFNPVTSPIYWTTQAAQSTASEAQNYADDPEGEDVPFEWHPAHPEWEFTIP